MYDHPRSDQFTQGTIFSCAYAENYSDQFVYGLVITARCDVAQDKAPIYNFIPVVSLQDWFLCDGAEIVLRRQEQDHLNTQKNILGLAELSTSLLRTKTTEDIVKGLLQPKADLDRKFESKVQQFIGASDELRLIQQALNQDDRQVKKTLLSRSQKLVDQTIKELAGNRLLGYYLLRQMPNIYGEQATDYVALLREVHHVPSALAKKIVSGIDKDSWKIDPIEKPSSCPKFHNDNDYCAPTARLKSPWIEHLMQSFTMLFARIGVDDVDYLAVKKSLAALGVDPS